MVARSPRSGETGITTEDRGNDQAVSALRAEGGSAQLRCAPLFRLTPRPTQTGGYANDVGYQWAQRIAPNAHSSRWHGGAGAV